MFQTTRWLVSFFFAGCKVRKLAVVVDTDDRSAFNLERVWQEERCRLLKLAQKYQSAIYSSAIADYVDYGKHFNRLNISGLACETNTSLTLIAMDSLLHYHFAERLGINISNRKDRTVAVIVNDKVKANCKYCYLFYQTPTNIKRRAQQRHLSRRKCTTVAHRFRYRTYYSNLQFDGHV